MIYHPLASTIIQIVEKSIIRYSKDLYEISFLQSTSGSAERFASISVETFVKDFKKSLDKNFFGSLYTSTILGTVVREDYGKKPIRLLFNPMDSFFNFSRGLSSFGISFSLQEEVDGILYDVFSIVYNFQTQEIIYSNSEGCYINGRLLKPVIRKALSLSFMCLNSIAAKRKPQLFAHFKNISISNSILTDISLLAKGKVDAIHFANILKFQLVPCLIIAKNMRIADENHQNIEISEELSRKSTTVFFVNDIIKKEIL